VWRVYAARKKLRFAIKEKQLVRELSWWLRKKFNKRKHDQAAMKI
jgi:predicted deacetylase